MLYVARHASTAHNSDHPTEERIRGWGDIGISAQGKAEAHAAADALRGTPPTLIFASDLPRAKETAELIAKELGGIPVVADQALRTWNVGRITGQPVMTAKPQLDRLQHQKPTQPAPEGESYADFYRRWAKIVGQLRQVGKQEDVLVVVHGRQVYSLPNILAHKGTTGIPTHGAPDPGDVLRVNEDTKRAEYAHRSGAKAKATA